MKRRLFMVASMSALLVAALVPGTTAARSPERSFGRPDAGGRTLQVDDLAVNRDPNRIVNVFVELAGQPVSTHMGAALDAGRELSEAEKAALRQPLALQQQNLKTKLRTVGATVEASYTDVLNAVRVSVPAGKLAQMAKLPGVTRISTVPTHYRDNTNTVDFLGADTAWGTTGFTGRGVKLAVIDSGINYYHRDFNGPAGYEADNGLDRTDGNFPTAKVVQGFDLVGDAYNPADDPLDPGPDADDVPKPDNDPLDCKDPESPNVQHGTHVAGTAAGYGVRKNGNTYFGPYNASTLENTNFRIGPGTAPEASLMAYRVFGCDGGTSVVVDAIERAVRDGADVINMSLGSNFGNPGSSDAVAVDNASVAGVTVVMSAGNDGPSAYVVGSPGVATRGIAVAAMDADPSFPSVWIDMPTGADIRGINANGDTNDLPVTGQLNHFEDVPATPDDDSLGCTVADFEANGFTAGQIAVTHRGTCARVDRAKIGDSLGAAAVIMINNAEGFPPFEGPIPGVDIPFIGVDGAVEDPDGNPATDDGRFHVDDNRNATIRQAPELDNPGYRKVAPFTSGGPRRFDNLVKPDVAAPGVGVFSADGSTVDQGKGLSGTSMSSPATAGVAALVKDAHPSWTPREIKAALIGSATPRKLDPYELRQAGAGVVSPKRAINTRGLAFAPSLPGTSSLTFGQEQVDRGPAGPTAYTETLKFDLKNTSSSAITYNLSNIFNTDTLGVDVSISPASVTVPAGARRSVNVTLSLSDAEAAALPDTAPGHTADLAVDQFGQLFSPLIHVAGTIIAKPTSGGDKLRIPWLVAPRGLSAINDNAKRPYTEGPSAYRSSAHVENYGLHAGIADLYAWGLQDSNDGLDGIDMRAGGVQSLPAEICTGEEDAADRCLVIAINTWNKWSNASENEFDVLIDTNEDGVEDYVVIGIDSGVVGFPFSGVYLSVILDLTPAVGQDPIVDIFLATAPNNGATMLLPVLASDLGLDSAANSEFDYLAQSFDYWDDDGTLFQFDLMTTSNTPPIGSQWARFDAYDHPISNGDFVPLGPGDSVEMPLRVKKGPDYQPSRGMKGWMIVTMEDVSGQTDQGQYQADLILVGNLPD